jgi:large subunit ribosomal protein L13
MLPKNKLRKQMISRLKLFTGTEHTFTAQKPEVIKL